MAHQAWLVPWKHIKELADRIGNQLYYEVQQPCEETQRRIGSLVAPGNHKTIPADACHLVLSAVTGI